jgi:hypothetical protein
MDLSRVLERVEPLTLARSGAFPIEDLGIVEIDRVVGNAIVFGESIRSELMENGVIRSEWWSVIQEIRKYSPVTHNPSMMLASLSRLATSKMFIEGRINPK